MLNRITEARQSWTGTLQLTHPDGEVFIRMIRQKDYLATKWFGHLTEEDIYVGASVFLCMLRIAPCSGILNDKSETTGDWLEANEWLEYEWIPQLVDAGVTCMANVYSSDTFIQLSGRDLAYRASKQKLQMQSFSDPQSAEAWLEQCLTR